MGNMVKMTKQTITTEEHTTTSEKIGILLTTLESQIIESSDGYSEGVKFRSPWDEIDQGLIKEKIMILVSEL